MTVEGRPWTPDEDAKLLLLAAAGLTYEDARVALDRSPDEVDHRLVYLRQQRILYRMIQPFSQQGDDSGIGN